MDNLALVFPLGLFFGRMGNYINKELLGFPYNGFLAVEKNGEYFFPSPLLEALLEGIILFFILQLLNKKGKSAGEISAYFLIFYGLFRSLVELFIRTPDAQIGYIYGFLSLGFLLSFPMFIIGIGLLYLFNRKKGA